MYIRKTKDIFYLLGWYGYGWDYVEQAETLKEMKQAKKEYQENQPEYIYKIVKKRIKL